jgi:molybdate/tungstate transport system permease protein
MTPRGSGSRLGTAASALLTGSLLALFLLPLLALATYAPSGAYAHALTDPQARLAIGFTLYASGLALGISLLFGVPAGYLLARRAFPGRSIVESLLGLPVVVPHLIAGLALLLLISPSNPVGAALRYAGVPIFGTLWGVVVVMTYVSAPYTILAATLAFRSVDDRLLEAARSLGASPSEAFATVTFPLAARGILAGALLTWARSVSEIGGFLILAYTVYPSAGYNGPVTSPISIYIYNLYEAASLADAAAVASIFVLIAFAIFVAVRFVERSGRLPWNRGELAP